MSGLLTWISHVTDPSVEWDKWLNMTALSSPTATQWCWFQQSIELLFWPPKGDINHRGPCSMITLRTACKGSNNNCFGWHGTCTTWRSNPTCLTIAERLNGLSSVREVNSENDAKLFEVKPSSWDKNVASSVTDAAEPLVELAEISSTT